ncbi:unnamed protein product [Trichobilharzia szidati]|nr:unnamed protein product [Trichobilharzia szidati]
MMLPSLLFLYTLIILVQCNIENNATYSTTASTSTPMLAPVSKANNYASTTPRTTDNAENVMTILPRIHNDPVNVTYVILPNEFYLGQINLITVRSRQPRTKLSIALNLTGLSKTIKDKNVYKLTRLNISQNWYGLDIPYQVPFIFDRQESISVKMIFNFKHCYKKDERKQGDDDDDDKNLKSVSQCINYKVTEIVHSVQLKQLPIVIIGETDKPLYRPGESVNFRYLALNMKTLSPKSTYTPLPKKKLIIRRKSKFQLIDVNHNDLSKLENIIYKKIYITDPMDNHVKQWLNISPKKALSLTYQLLNNTVEGKWKVHAVVGRHLKETLEFTVKKYTLPKFTISLETPKVFNFDSEYVRYSVCAKYTNGPPVKGSVKSILCVCSEYAWDNEYSKENDENTAESVLLSRRCPSTGYTLNLRPCIIHNQLLHSDGCASFNVSTKQFAFSTEKYFKWNQIGILCAHVEEDGTGSKLYNCLKGHEIKTGQPNLKLEFPSVYKSKLPITGRVKLTNHEKSRNYSVKISVSEQKRSCFQTGSEKGTEYYFNTIPLNSLNEGVIHIPPLQSENSILIEAELMLTFEVQLPASPLSSVKSTSKDARENSPKKTTLVHINYHLWSRKPRSSQSSPVPHSVTLKSWDSISKVYLQLWPPRDRIFITTCPNTVKLVLLSNIHLSDKIIFIESMVRGEHKKIVIPAIDKMTSNDITDDCVDRDDELGHYECTGVNPEEIKCLPGWQGENCLVPICSTDCNPKGGLCAKPGECQCKSGWKNVNCDKCVERKNCLYGTCVHGNDCVCEDGWTGHYCDRKTVVYKEITKDNEINTKKSVNGVNPTDELESSFISSPSSTNSSQIKTKPLRTLYQRHIEFTINGSWGPSFTAIIYIHNQQDNASPEIISTQLNVENIENCTSNAIAIQSKSHKSNIEFSQNVAHPGKKIQMTITPQGVSSSATSLMDQDNSCYNLSRKLCRNKGQLSNELCFIRISDTSLDNFQGDKNLINLKSFTEKLVDYAMQSRKQPSIATSTQEAFQAAGFQIGSTYPETMLIHPVDACPQFSNPSISGVLYDMGIGNNHVDPVSTQSPEKPRLRDFFPEVWLFRVLPITDLKISHEVDAKATNTDTSEINKSRGIQLSLTVPDTITSWRASAYCTTKSNGLWIGESQTVTVNMPFYLEITPPKEMKRGEILHIPVSMFILDTKYLQIPENSNLSECYEILVDVQVNNDDWLVVGTTKHSGCLCSGDKTTYLIGLQAKRLGKLNITAEALAIKNSQSCQSIEYSELKNALTAQSNIFKRKRFQSKLLTDKIRRHINVIPEGVQHETTISDIICLSEQENQSERKFEFVLPKNMIKNSLHSYISYSDEVLGPALVNLDKLVRLPTGCGEQNMVLVAPNVYILDYLKSTPTINENKENYIEAAKSHITSGYVQQLKYRRDDGSFSAFGKSDKQGSTWLTAFVVRVFAKAYKLEPTLNIEWENLFRDGVKFLKTRQNAGTGCFEEHGKVIYSPLQGGILGRDGSQLKDILLTSYVSSALFETQPNEAGNNLNIKYTIRAKDAYNGGLKCLSQYLLQLESYDELPTSALVQITHTYALIQPNSHFTNELKDNLIKREQVIQDQFGEMIYWSDKFDKSATNTFNSNNNNNNNIEPRDLESTAYAFLSLSRLHQPVNALFPIIRWISSKQKSNGGFYSTQDTVLGLEAIAEFAKILGVHSNNNNNNNDNEEEDETDASYNVLQISNHVNIGNFNMNDSITLEKRQVINQIELPNLEFKDADVDADNDDKVIHSVWKLTSNQPVKDCMLVQNTFIYNLPEVENVNTKFQLSYQIIQKTSPTDDANCKTAKLVMCLQLNSRIDENPISTGMLLIRVAMVTGWKPIVEQLNLQLGPEDDSLKMLTINEQNEISLYFNEFSEEEAKELGDWKQLKRCVDVPINQAYYVENAKNATITAYEYYSPEESITVTYRLNDCKAAWDKMDKMLHRTSSEPTPTTKTPLKGNLSKVKTVCPVCTDKVNDTQLLLNDIYNSVCHKSNGIYFLKVHEIQNNSINTAITHISQSNVKITWNTILQMPDSNKCPCELIKTHQNLVVIFDKFAEISPGKAKFNIETLNTPVKFISNKEILPILELAADKWSNSEKATLTNILTDELTAVHYCKVLPKLVEFIKQTK